MNSVEFDEQNEFHIKSRKLFGDPETPTMVRLLLKSHIVKNEQQALVVLFFVAFIAAGATWWILTERNQRIDFVDAPNGTRYSVEEYVQLLGQGIDPLNPTQTEK